MLSVEQSRGCWPRNWSQQCESAAGPYHAELASLIVHLLPMYPHCVMISIQYWVGAVVMANLLSIHTNLNQHGGVKFFSRSNSFIQLPNRWNLPLPTQLYAIAITGYCCCGVAFSASKVPLKFSFFCLVPRSWLGTRETSCSGVFRSSYATAAVKHLSSLGKRVSTSVIPEYYPSVMTLFPTSQLDYRPLPVLDDVVPVPVQNACCVHRLCGVWVSQAFHLGISTLVFASSIDSCFRASAQLQCVGWWMLNIISRFSSPSYVKSI